MREPIEKSVLVPLPPAAAFDLFASGIDRWWPKASHSLSAGEGHPARRVTIEPRKGGRIAELRHDGAVVPWATVTEWRPGEALAFDWYVGRPEAEATQVRVTFTAAPGGTRVDLVHTGFGDALAAAARCESYRTGWDAVLGGCYCAAAARVAARAA